MYTTSFLLIPQSVVKILFTIHYSFIMYF